MSDLMNEQRRANTRHNWVLISDHARAGGPPGPIPANDICDVMAVLYCRDCGARAHCVNGGADLRAIPPCDAPFVRGEPAE